MSSRQLTVENRLGLHARASAQVVRCLGPFEANLLFRFRGREINPKSIMGLMLLAASRGSVIEVEAEGADADAALEALTQLFAERFGEAE